MAKKSRKKSVHRRTKDKKDLVYLHHKTREKIHEVIKRPGHPFTLRDHLMMAHTEKMLLSEEHSIYQFMKAGLLFLIVGIILIIVFRNIVYELLGWAAIVIGFLEILESYHRMDRWKKEMNRLKRS